MTNDLEIGSEAGLCSAGADLEVTQGAGARAGEYVAEPRPGVSGRGLRPGRRAGLLIEPLDAALGELELDRRQREPSPNLESERRAGPNSNRRSARRYRVLLSGLVVHADFSASVPCIIRNLSEGGAGISIDEDWKAPETFWLIRIVERLACEATPAWRHGAFAGLRLGPGFDVADPENPTAARLLQILTAAAED